MLCTKPRKLGSDYIFLKLGNYCTKKLPNLDLIFLSPSFHQADGAIYLGKLPSFALLRLSVGMKPK